MSYTDMKAPAMKYLPMVELQVKPSISEISFVPVVKEIVFQCQCQCQWLAGMVQNVHWH
jgi:hypothetical protein